MAQRVLKLRAAPKDDKESDAASFVTDVTDDNAEVRYFADLQTYVDMGIEAERFHIALVEAMAAFQFNQQKLGDETRLRTLNDIYQSFKQWKLMLLQIDEKQREILENPLAADALQCTKSAREVLLSAKVDQPIPQPASVLLQKLKGTQHKSALPDNVPSIEEVLTRKTKPSPPKSKTYEQYMKVQGMLIHVRVFDNEQKRCVCLEIGWRELDFLQRLCKV